MQHLREVDAGRGSLRIREVEGARAQQRGAKRVLRGDLRQRLAAAHRQAGRHGTQGSAYVGHQLVRGLERLHHRVGHDHHVAGLTAKQCLFQDADRAETGLQRHAGLLLEAFLQRLDDALYGACAENVQGRRGVQTRPPVDVFIGPPSRPRS